MQTLNHSLAIEFLFIDLETCTRCLGTEDALDTAIEITRPALNALGVDITIEKTLVETEEQARAVSLQSSPTIRMGHKDISGELKESDCQECGDVCGTETDCRVWPWQGQDHLAAPVGLLVQAILNEVTSQKRATNEASDGFLQRKTKTKTVPDNLKQFFAHKAESSGKPDGSKESESVDSTRDCCSPTCCQ